MDDLRRRLEEMEKRLDDFGGALQDVQVEQKAITQQSQRVESAMTKLSGAFDLFKVSVRDVFEGLIQHDTDQLRWRHVVEDRLSNIERKLAG